MATATRRNSAAPKKDPKAKDPKRAWYFVVDLPREVGGMGEAPKRKQVLRRGFATKSDAQAALDALRVDGRKGVHVDRSTITVGQYLEEWIAGLPGTVRESTAHSYASTLRSHVIPRIGAVPLQALRSTELEALYVTLRAPGANKRDKSGKTGLSQRTVRYAHVIIKRALREAVDHGLLVANPAAKVRTPAHVHEAGKIKAWSRDDLRTFLARSEADDDRDFALWRLIASTGMRRGEALGLHIEDLDLDAETVTIKRTVITVNYAVLEGSPKTAAGARTIKLDGRTVAALKAHKAKRASERLLLGHGQAKADDWLFATPTGEWMHPGSVSKIFDRRVARYGLPHIGIHGLRHTWATLALLAGENPRIVQKRLGHRDVSVTLMIYSHVTEGMDQDAAQRVANLFD